MRRFTVPFWSVCLPVWEPLYSFTGLYSVKLMTGMSPRAQSAQCYRNRCCCEACELGGSVLWCRCLPACCITHVGGTDQNNETLRRSASSAARIWWSTSPTLRKIHSSSPVNLRLSFSLSGWSALVCILKYPQRFIRLSAFSFMSKTALRFPLLQDRID